MREKKANKIKIMVGSTVYGYEDQLSAIVGLLTTLGYEVLNSHAGTVKVNPNLSNLENCLNAVDECDLFLGIIRPFYGSGNIGEKNIAFEEFKRAIELKKPYWFLAHRDVVFARQLFKNIKVKEGNKNLLDVIEIKKNSIFDYRCLEVYDFIVKDSVPIESRQGNWVQEFYRLDEALTFINAQFSDKDEILNIINWKEAIVGK
jgi:hypothetical protein